MLTYVLQELGLQMSLSRAGTPDSLFTLSTMPHQVPPLNDDVLRAIVDYLHGSDALSSSLTASKHVYELAIHRVSAVIKCKCIKKLCHGSCMVS